jgi:dihydropteroate synthase
MMTPFVEKRPAFSLKCRGKTLHLGLRTQIMGILNVTPDSFSDGGTYYEPAKAIARAFEIESEGADILDIGGESTRPGAAPVSWEEEQDRILPVIEAVAGKVSIPISIDTRHARVASAAIEYGASMINDISGLFHDSEMASTAAHYQVPVIIMHSSGDPQVMQSRVDYKSLISDIIRSFELRIQLAIDAGIKQESIVIDPGIGFGKTVSQNFQIIKNLDRFLSLGYPLLIGVSRKSFIGKTLGLPEGQRIYGTAAAVTACILNGIHIIRVHDVAVMKQVAAIADHLLQGG